MRVYLDNCSYNRPYDDQSQMRIHLETQAKLHIQDIIRSGEIELVTSYVLDFENSNNRSIQKMMAIEKFMKEYATVYVSNKNEKDISNLAKAIMETGIKEKDAYHVACAVMAECDYFVTTDDRLLKFQSEKTDTNCTGTMKKVAMERISSVILTDFSFPFPSCLV